MQLETLAKVSRKLTETQSRTAKVEALASVVAGLPGAERAAGIALLSGELRQGRIGVGWKSIERVLPPAPAGGPTLSVADVDAAFDAIAGLSGGGSTAAKLDRLRALFERATADELKLLIGVLSGGLRQGALEGMMVSAVAKAARVKVTDLRRAVMFAGDFRAVAVAALERGLAGLAEFRLQHFRPVRPMLAQTALDAADAIAGLGLTAFEHKLDGARIQVHKAGGRVAVYTRRLNDVTGSVPELVELVAALPCESAVLDGEAIALRDDGRPQPFQVTMRRFGRTAEVERMRRELPLSASFFDCLECDGRTLIDRPLGERRVVLERLVEDASRVPQLLTSDPETADTFVTDALDAGHEGVMAKAADGSYEAGSRASGWLKIKPAHTLDLVVLAAEWGHGRRRGRLSNLHLGARDEDSGEFVMLGKTFKGLTDEVLEWQTRELLARELKRQDITVFVRPELVVEIALADVQSSPHYPAGLALRFARVKRYRPDKTPAEVDTLATARRIRQDGHRRA